MIILSSDPNTALHYSKPALLKELSGNFSMYRLTGAVFLYVAKAFSTVLVDGLLYNPSVRNCPSYLVKTFLPTCMVRLLKCPSNQPYLLVTCGQAWNRLQFFTSSSGCQRHAITIPWRRVGILRWRHSHHSHVPPASTPLSDLEQWLREWIVSVFRKVRQCSSGSLSIE
jgi:hypothetical protein